MARKTDGWVKIHSKILEEDLSPSQFKFFVGSIVLANPPTSNHWGIVDLSLRQLAKELKMSPSEVWRREQELAQRGMITIQKHGFLINKYLFYQTGKTVSPTEQLGEQPSHSDVSPAEQKVPPTEQNQQTVPPTEQTVPLIEPKPSPKKKEVRGKEVRSKEKFTIPEWIDKATWEAFLEMRKKKRAIPTEKAKELLVKELEKLRAAGNDPNEVLNQSIMRNYTGVFPVKGGQSGTHRQNSRQLRPRQSYTHPKDYRA